MVDVRACSWEMRLRVDLRAADRAARREEREDISKVLLVTEGMGSRSVNIVSREVGLLA